jgi:hypothetical protein
MFRNLLQRLFLQRLFAAALLLPLVAFATATGGHWLRCSVTGAVVDACCCGGDADGAATTPTTTISERDCCDRVDSHVSPSVAELTAAETAAPDAASAALPLEAASIQLVSAPAQPRVAARSSLGPPTARLRLLAKSSLLI